MLILVATLGAQDAPPGEDESSDESSGEFSIEPFEIRIPDAVLADLEERIDRTRWPDQIEGSGWDYGTDMSYLRELVQYWRTDYDWRAEEARLNRFDHFKTEIDGLNIHFIHQRSKEPNARALVITHGCPGSVFEFVKIIGPLTDPTAYGGRAEDAFHVICPSLPG
ncbi:MAG: epoxide hydrolase N-terminal domain-containing protein, partial [Planctomycetes bacterium]|nr:epoxide hydrolase N-terminal domain-containing protein [Planctomycetota bacterium]